VRENIETKGENSGIFHIQKIQLFSSPTKIYLESFEKILRVFVAPTYM